MVVSIKNGCLFDEKAAKVAATEGHLEILKWLIENNCPWEPEKYLEDIHIEGRIESWIKKQLRKIRNMPKY